MAVKTRDALKAENASDFQDNVAQLISPADLRGQMDDTADSALFPEDIPGLDVSAAHVTSSLSVITKTLGAWAEDIGTGGGGGGGADGASEFNTVAAMLASMDVAQGQGTVWRADGFRYREADPAATDHHLTTAGGVKLYVMPGDDGWYNFLAMGPARDGATNDADKLKKLLAIRPLGPVAPGSDPWPLGPSIHIPAGIYFMDAGPWGFQIKAITRIRGEGYSPGSWGHATVCRFPVNCCGFVFNHYDTMDDYIEPEKPYGTGGTLGSIFERIHVEGVLTTTGGNPNAHGIWARTSISIRDTTVSKFNGNGINCVGTSTPGSFQIWTSGTDYAAGAYIQTNGGKNLYYCSLDPGAVLSTVEPTHTSGSVTGADGYRWLYFMDPKNRGGPSYMMLYAVSSIGNRNAGIYLDGGDSNAGGGMHCNAYANGRYGIFDSNFLGNTWIACHSRGNGLAGDGGNPANQSAIVSLRNGPPTGAAATTWTTGTNYALNDNILASNGNYYKCTVDPGAGLSTIEPTHSGDALMAVGEVIEADGYGWSRAGTYNKYYAKWATTPAQLVATAPGTDNNIWVSGSMGGVNVGWHPYYPVWQPAQPEGTYFYGSGYIGDNPNARNIFIGCYAEGDEPPGYLSPTSMAMGGIASWQKGSGHVYADGGMMASVTGWRVTDTFGNDVRLAGDQNSSATLFRAISYHSVAEPLSWIWQYVAGTGDWGLQYGGSAYAHYLTTVNTTQKMGTSKTQPYLMHFPVLAVGGSTTTRRQSTNSAKPTTGEYAAGDVVWNAATSTTSFAGWLCTTAGVLSAAAWATGTDYAVNAYILATNTKYYRCSVDPGGVITSTVEPSHASGEVVGADGYGWTFVSNTVGALTPFGQTVSQQTLTTDAAFTLTPASSARFTRHSGVLTANRAVTLTTTGAFAGMEFRITRTGVDAFALNVGTGPLKALATNSWCSVVFDGTAWNLSAYGTL